LKKYKGGFMDISSIDFSILNFIQDVLKCTFMDWTMAFFSVIGNAGIVWIVAGVAMLFFKKTRAAGVMVLCTVLLGFITGELIIKNIVARPRPFLVNTDITLFIKAPSGYSFPSGHSCAGMASSAVLLAKHKRLGIPALCVAVIIAFSRLYNYVHYPSDVLCGVALGVLSALLVMFIFRKTGLEKRLSPVKAD
jgi:undecaprenyl-diphosphatase